VFAYNHEFNLLVSSVPALDQSQPCTSMSDQLDDARVAFGVIAYASTTGGTRARLELIVFIGARATPVQQKLARQHVAAVTAFVRVRTLVLRACAARVTRVCACVASNDSNVLEHRRVAGARCEESWRAGVHQRRRRCVRCCPWQCVQCALTRSTRSVRSHAEGVCRSARGFAVTGEMVRARARTPVGRAVTVDVRARRSLFSVHAGTIAPRKTGDGGVTAIEVQLSDSSIVFALLRFGMRRSMPTHNAFFVFVAFIGRQAEQADRTAAQAHAIEFKNYIENQGIMVRWLCVCDERGDRARVAVRQRRARRVRRQCVAVLGCEPHQSGWQTDTVSARPIQQEVCLEH
jgi:hypothetical protein